MNDIIFEKGEFNIEGIDSISNELHLDYPALYILSGRKAKPKAYIGETINCKKRLKQHLKDKKESISHFTLVGHEHFNKSATYNLETKLINYFIGDEQYELLNTSQTVMEETHNYYHKEVYNEELFPELWEQLLEMKIVKHTMDQIENKDVFKLSPFKELSMDQLEVKRAIIDYCENIYSANDRPKQKQVFVISGEAGTGKSVVLSSTLNSLIGISNRKESSLHKKEFTLLVNHSEMLKAYESIAENLKHLKKNNFKKPTTFINDLNKHNNTTDIVLIDEGHLLLTEADSYNNFNQQNQLDEIIKLADVVIVVFDFNQHLKNKTKWTEVLLEKVIKNNKAKRTDLKLETQFRMSASDEVFDWVKAFRNKDILPLPKDKNYPIKICASLKEMHYKISELNKEFGLCRLVSTFDYIHKKDGNEYKVEIDGYGLPWNNDYKNKTWAEEDTIDEVGSIYTIQGFDLNYVGVNLGPSVSFDKINRKIVIKPEFYKDTGAFQGTGQLDNSEEVKEQMILNSINVLLTRGIKGLYIHAEDKDLKEYLLQLQENNNER